MVAEGLNIYQWEDVMRAAIDIAKRITVNREAVDCIVGISRGGMVFATLLAELLQKSLCSVSITRRVNGIECFDEPRVLNCPGKEMIYNANVLLVDEIIVTGKTLKMAMGSIKDLGAKTVKTCAIINRSNGMYASNYIFDFKETDCTIFPWDYYVINSKGEVEVHPEYLLIDHRLRSDLYGVERKQ